MSRADHAAESGGWVWVRADDLRPGDVQVFAGNEMTVESVKVGSRHVDVRYKDAPRREFARALEVGVRPEAGNPDRENSTAAEPTEQPTSGSREDR